MIVLPLDMWPDDYHDALRQASRAVLAAPSPEARACAEGALFGLCERAAATNWFHRGAGWQAGTLMLYAHLADQPMSYAEIAARVGIAASSIKVVAWRLRRAGLLPRARGAARAVSVTNEQPC